MSSPSATAFEHVRIDDNGIPIIAGTTIKVVELVMAQKAHGWSPEEIHFQHQHLSMSQIHSALAYYWEHKDDLDADIERRRERVESLRADEGESSLAVRLRDRGQVE